MGHPTQHPRSTYIEIIVLVSVQMHFTFGSSMIEPDIRALLANLLEDKLLSLYKKRQTTYSNAAIPTPTALVPILKTQYSSMDGILPLRRISCSCCDFARNWTISLKNLLRCSASGY